MTSQAWLILSALVYVSVVTLITCGAIISRDKSADKSAGKPTTPSA